LLLFVSMRKSPDLLGGNSFPSHTLSAMSMSCPFTFHPVDRDGQFARRSSTGKLKMGGPRLPDSQGILVIARIRSGIRDGNVTCLPATTGLQCRAVLCNLKVHHRRIHEFRASPSFRHCHPEIVPKGIWESERLPAHQGRCLQERPKKLISSRSALIWMIMSRF
jgi:hypothetical protein